jgi:CRP/FNR family transcriptional regulator, anaerobic regulatory protein
VLVYLETRRRENHSSKKRKIIAPKLWQLKYSVILHMLEKPILLAPLFEKLNGIAKVPTALNDALLNSFELEDREADTHLLKEGQVCDRLWYLANGILRAYHIIEDKDITSRIMFTGHIVIAPTSFFYQVPSRENIVTLTACTLLSIRFDKLQEIYKSHPEFNFHTRLITENYFSKQEDRLYMLRLQNAEAKYAYFLKHYEQIAEQIPTYLNMTPETLSRIRRKLATKKPR